ncbi:MAG: LysM domain-containing protein [Desulfobacteraceae bacterium]
MAVIVLIPSSPLFGGSLVYKNYIIRYDRGWDILCEPYVVQKDDWVLKIFRQKGEIAHQDFRDFLGIFKRLNPHIKNIDMIRPGQGIDIPLRKLEHGALPGQASGVVTIPFVTLTEVTEVIKQHSETYKVQKGDTVSRLIARKYGRYGTKSYQEGVKLFKAANPHVQDINLIYAGQRLYLPDPTIREKSWYASIYDAQGNLRKSMDRTASSSPQEAQATPIPVPPTAVLAEPEEKPESNLAAAADFVGGKLNAKGTYYLPRKEGGDYELDLSKHPMLEFANGPKLVFTPGRTVMNMDKGQFQSNWPDITPVTVDTDATTEQYVSAIFNALDEEGKPAAEVTIENQGVHIAIKAKWIRTEDEGRQLCITPIASADQQTPESIRRYLEQNGVVIKEILPDGTAMGINHGNLQRHNIKNILALTPTSQKDFVQVLAKSLGFSYIPNTNITFPYAGIQVEAYANLLSTKDGREALVDFGDLYGDAVKAISKTGLNVVQISPEETYDDIAQKLLAALSINFEQHPTLLAAQRAPEFNTAITIYGLLFSNNDNRRVLLTSATLHSAITDMLSNQGIDVVVW